MTYLEDTRVLIPPAHLHEHRDEGFDPIRVYNNTSEQTRMSEEKTRFGCFDMICLALFILIIFVFFVFQCIALNNSDTEIFYKVCGHTLRTLILSSVVISTVAGFLALVLYLGSELNVINVYVTFYINLLLFYTFIELILSAFIIIEGYVAMDSTNCTLAMKNTTGGMNSISANTGYSLLAMVGLISSIGSWGVAVILAMMYSL